MTASRPRSGPLKMYRDLGRPVYVIVAATIINRFGDFVVPFLALYLTKRLGYSDAAAGIAVTVVGSGSFIGALLGGRIADRFGRRRLLLSTYAMSGIVIMSAGFLVRSAELQPMLLPLLVLNGVTKGAVRPALRSILTDLSRPERRKDTFSLNYLGINIGVALGPLLAGYLFENHLPWLFWGDAITSLIASALILIWVPETLPDNDAGLSEDEAFESDPPLRAFFRRPLVVIFTVAMAFQGMVYAQFGFTLPLHIDRLFSDGAVRFSHVIVFNAVLVLLLTPLFTRLTTRFHALAMSAVASSLYVIGFGLLAFEPVWGWYFALTAVWTSGEIIAVIHQMGYFSTLIPGNYRGQFNSYSSIMMQLSHVGSPAVGGLIIATAGITGMWATVSALAGVSVVIFLLLFKYEDRLRYRRPPPASVRSALGDDGDVE
jgi:predicted MFS family arabinose efflux permease